MHRARRGRTHRTRRRGARASSGATRCGAGRAHVPLRRRPRLHELHARAGRRAGAALARQFAAIAEELAPAHNGVVQELRGDEALVVFDSARQALRYAVAFQAKVAEDELPRPVGIGLDAGEAVPVEGGYRGGALNRAARLCSLAKPGEVPRIRCRSRARGRHRRRGLRLPPRRAAQGLREAGQRRRDPLGGGGSAPRARPSYEALREGVSSKAASRDRCRRSRRGALAAAAFGVFGSDSAGFEINKIALLAR